jgi:hypothetical protein
MSGGEVIIILAVLFVTIVVPAAVVAAIVLLLVKRSSTRTTSAGASAPAAGATLLPGPVQVQGRPLKCLVCGHDNFRTSAATPGRADVAYTCAQCGYLHWFVPT